MTLSPRTRRIAAVLVVVFVLTTVWAAYYLYAETHPAGGASSGTVVAVYSQSAVGSFAAALRPSVLYNNSTEVFGGNITLFTPITNWINASIGYTVETNRSATISLSESFDVTLSTPVWSKTLYSALNSSTLAGTTSASLTTPYAINVSSVVALANAIDSQVGYQGNAYTLSLNPLISGLVSAGGVEQSISSEPRLNFTFAGSIVTPSGLTYASSGSLVAPAPASTTSTLGMIAPYLALFGSVGGLGGSAWVATRRPTDERVPPLDELIEPYQEAIAATARAPAEAVVTPVESFPDLVKIADTLGKPILRPTADPAAPPSFLVVDGLIAYRYEYPGASAQPGPGAPPGALAERPEEPVPTEVTADLIQRLQQELPRLRGLALDRATDEAARGHVRKAIELLQLGYEVRAEAEVDALSVLLTAAAERSRRGT